MTHIVVGFKSKKAVREALERNERIHFADPAIINATSFYSDDIPIGRHFAFTNHPKRSFFGSLFRKEDGTILFDGKPLKVGKK